ncbi:MAG: MBL fold metallo-hydrolase [Umezawaea sp.]
MRQVTVLGSCGAYPEPGRACSGFLVEWDGFRLVLDLGYATLPRLLDHCPDGAVDAVVITHEHPDHCIDLHGLFRTRFYGGEGSKLPLYCAPGVLTRLSGPNRLRRGSAHRRRRPRRPTRPDLTSFSTKAAIRARRVPAGHSPGGPVPGQHTSPGASPRPRADDPPPDVARGLRDRAVSGVDHLDRPARIVAVPLVPPAPHHPLPTARGDHLRSGTGIGGVGTMPSRPPDERPLGVAIPLTGVPVLQSPPSPPILDVEQADRDAVQARHRRAGQHLPQRRLADQQHVQPVVLVVQRTVNPPLQTPLAPPEIRRAGHADLVEVVHDHPADVRARAGGGGLAGATGTTDHEQHETSVPPHHLGHKRSSRPSRASFPVRSAPVQRGFSAVRDLPIKT